MGVQEVFDLLFDELENLDSDDFEIQMQTGSFIITFEDDNSVFMLSQQTPTRELAFSKLSSVALFAFFWNLGRER